MTHLEELDLEANRHWNTQHKHEVFFIANLKKKNVI